MPIRLLSIKKIILNNASYQDAVMIQEESMVKLVIRKEVKFQNPVVIEGLPEVGLVGSIAALYLLEQLKLDPIAYFESNLIPPVMVVHNYELLSPIRIYGNEKYVIITSEIAIPPEIYHELSARIISWCKSIGAQTLISLNGIPTDNRFDIEKPAVFGIASKKSLLELLSKHKIEALQEGFIAGMYALLLKDAADADLSAIALVAQSFVKYPDPGASAEVLNALNKILQIQLDVSPLVEKAEEVRLKARDLMRQADQTTPYPQKTVEGELPIMYK